MSDRVWSGFKPDVSPLPAKPRSVGEQLDDIEIELEKLEERRKELLHEEAKEEVLADLENGEDSDLHKKVHKDCVVQEEHQGELEIAREEGWELLREYGSHTARCLAGALVGSQDLHPLCTCGWNHIATELERAKRSGG